METTSECRCCLGQGALKKINLPYTWLGKKEVYCDIIKECFNISLASHQCTNLICELCIVQLRQCIKFKRKVFESEQELIKRSGEIGKDEKPYPVKLEPLDHDSADDSDDYFLASTFKDVTVKKIKSEPKEHIKKKDDKVKRRISDSQKKERHSPKDNIKKIVGRLAGSINTRDGPQIKKKKSRTIMIEKSSKINLMWTRSTHTEKIKHRENLLTILKFSNVIPFKKKSLLGYVCGYCDNSYLDPVYLRVHTEKDHKKERLEFKSSFDMTDYSVNLDVTDLMCTICDSKVDNLALLKDHLINNHEKTFYVDIKDHILEFKLKKGDVYDCAKCPSTYETFKMLKQHMNKHYSNYMCSKCETGFATKRSLNAHHNVHLEGSFKCDHCDKVFASRSKKCYHEKIQHLGERNISNCPHCNEPFRSYYQRNQHLIKVHNSEAQYKCNVCNKAYILKSLLMYHIKKNHLMEKNCQCTECGYRFFSKKALKAHMVKHTGEKIYACEVCNKSYARKYTLREHMRIHNNDRRFKCDVCGLTFVQKCSLKSHLLSNHGISMAASEITSILEKDVDNSHNLQKISVAQNFSREKLIQDSMFEDRQKSAT